MDIVLRLVPRGGHALVPDAMNSFDPVPDAAVAVGLSPPRWMRAAWLTLSIAGIVFIIALATASNNSPLFTRYYTEILIANAAIVIGLAILVIYQIVLLLRARRAAVFGSKLTTRMMMFFAVTAVLPGALVYSLSVQFLSSSIESFFDTRIDKALDTGLQLGRSALTQPLKELTRKTESIAATLSSLDAAEARARLGNLRDQADLTNVSLLAVNGSLIAQATESVVALPPNMPSSMELRQVRSMQTVTSVEPVGDTGLQLKVIAPVAAGDGSPLRLLIVTLYRSSQRQVQRKPYRFHCQ